MFTEHFDPSTIRTTQQVKLLNANGDPDVTRDYCWYRTRAIELLRISWEEEALELGFSQSGCLRVRVLSTQSEHRAGKSSMYLMTACGLVRSEDTLQVIATALAPSVGQSDS